MAINERLVHTASAAAAAGTGNQEEGLILHLDANDVDSYDGDGDVWYDIHDYEYTPATDVSEHFNTVLYTGSASAQTISATTIGFQPDLVWLKNRDGSYSHRIFDTVRGANERLLPDSTAANSTRSGIYSELSSFSDGFTLEPTNRGVSDSSGDDYVAWCFKAGGVPSGSDKVSIDGTSYTTMSAAELTDGTIPVDKLSVNTNLGFSIASYNGNQVSNATVAHGLGVKPELIIVKNLESAVSWGVWTTGISDSEILRLEQTAAATTPATAYFEPQNNTSNVFSLGTNDETNHNDDYIAYCFASKRGVSKVGSYTGTGATNKVYTGFEPAFIIGKCSSDNVTNWWTFDNKREDKVLYPNLSNSEDTLSDYVSFNRDGFTLSSAAFVNQSGRDFIYYAVAKNTNETSLIPDTDLELHLDAGDNATISTSTWSDKTSNNNNVTLTNFSSTLTDFYEKEVGNYIKFDGLNDLATSALPVTATGDVTMEAWVRFTDSTNTSIYPYITHLGHGDVDGSGFSMARFANTGADAYKFYSHLGGSYQVSNKVLEEDRWYHICATWAGTSLKQYVDGELVGNHTLTFNKNLYNAFTVGAYRPTNATYAHYLKGGLGQVRVYQSALTQDQIRQNFNFTKPSYPNGNDGELINMSSSDWNSNGYFTFSSDNDRIQPSFQPNVTVPFTMSVWAKKESGNSGFKTVIDYTQNASPYNGVGISHSGTGDYIIALNGGSSVTIGSATSYFDHLVFVYNGGTSCKTYINGVGTSGTLSAAVQQPNSSTNFVVGNSYVSTWGASRMSVSDVKFYSRALTDAEVTTEYNLGYNGII